jgi:hypothetical protein
MAGHTSEKRWRRNQTPESGQGISDQTQQMATSVVSTLLAAEQLYLEMLELYQYCGSTTQGLADQLFLEDWSDRESDPIGNPGVLDTQANAAELAKAQDVVDAITAAHELYQAADNQTVAQEDRLAQLRRMSA